ncbi:MAG: LysM domain-containing protein, partial [Polaromonas sp.]
MQTIFGRFSQISIAAAALLGTSLGLQAQNFPTTPDQKATAIQVAQTGVPLADLAPNASDSYTVRRGDTLWAISGMFLKSPWRWPELWGMNLEDIRNPHRIYPGQQLYLDKSNGRATLRTRRAGGDNSSAPMNTVRVSPRTRYETLAD